MIENARSLSGEKFDKAKFGSRDGEFIYREKIRNLNMEVLYDETGRRFFLKMTFESAEDDISGHPRLNPPTKESSEGSLPETDSEDDGNLQKENTEILLDIRNCKVTHKAERRMHVIKDDISAREYVFATETAEDFLRLDRFLSINACSCGFGTNPICSSAFWPSLNTATYGMELIPNEAATSGLSSTSIA